MTIGTPSPLCVHTPQPTARKQSQGRVVTVSIHLITHQPTVGFHRCADHTAFPGFAPHTPNPSAYGTQAVPGEVGNIIHRIIIQFTAGTGRSTSTRFAPGIYDLHLTHRRYEHQRVHHRPMWIEPTRSCERTLFSPHPPQAVPLPQGEGIKGVPYNPQHRKSHPSDLIHRLN